jgi:hypothetical protein
MLLHQNYAQNSAAIPVRSNDKLGYICNRTTVMPWYAKLASKQLNNSRPSYHYANLNKIVPP